MPNIIKLQDLLKGLPDARLATLMQNPVGDIPPFLVAAEAQRRQAIRQQFAGAGANESVVDTLTKQMANVPQNVQAPMQAPPQLPPPPMPQQMAPQGGIGALPPQGMADGGMVQRYYNGSLVQPSFRGRAGAGGYETPSSTWGVLGDLYDTAATSVGSFTENLKKFGLNPTVEQRAQLDAENEAAAPAPEISGYVDPFVAAKRPAIRRPEPTITQKPTLPRNPESSNQDTSYENKYKAEEAAMRDRLASLYGSGEPSNWEEAQKWFAMSQQIMNPDANLLQGIINAGNVYAQAESEQAKARRDDERALEEALLKWDMSALESRRSSEAQAQQNQIEAMKYQSEMALKEAEYYRRAADDAREKLNRRISALTSGGMMGVDEAANDAEVKKLQDEIAEYNRLGSNAAIQSKGFRTIFGNRYSLPAGFEQSDGDSISVIGG